MSRRKSIVKTKILPGVEMLDDGRGGFILKQPPAVEWPSLTEAARAFGQAGGMAGTGASKARDPEKMKAAALKRWASHKKKKS